MGVVSPTTEIGVLNFYQSESRSLYFPKHLRINILVIIEY